jgi:hypothetical protein
MRSSSYIVWVNDRRYVHRTFREALRHLNRAQLQGKDTFLHPENLRVVTGKSLPPRGSNAA